MFKARDRKQIVPVVPLPRVDQPCPPLAMIPEKARADLDARGRAMVRMARDAHAALTR